MSYTEEQARALRASVGQQVADPADIIDLDFSRGPFLFTLSFQGQIRKMCPGDQISILVNMTEDGETRRFTLTAIS